MHRQSSLASGALALDRLPGLAALHALPEGTQAALYRALRAAIEQREAAARAEVVT
jgi:hypothetical protein